MTIDCGLSITSSLTIMLRRTGRQCIKKALLVQAMCSASTVQEGSCHMPLTKKVIHKEFVGDVELAVTFLVDQLFLPVILGKDPFIALVAAAHMGAVGKAAHIRDPFLLSS